MKIFRHVVLILVILFVHLLPIMAGGYGFIDVPDGLSDRRVLSIQKDSTGFVWFLTYAGIDRYDGKNFKHYRLQNENGYIEFCNEEGFLKTDSRGIIWVIAPKGEIYGYDPIADRFTLVSLAGDIPIHSAQWVDLTMQDEVWFCLDGQIYVYNLYEKSVRNIPMSHILGTISCIHGAFDGKNYYIGSESGVSKAFFRDNELDCSASVLGPDIVRSPSVIYYHQPSERLFVASDTEGLIVYDMVLKKVEKKWPWLKEFPVTSIIPNDDFSLLIATRGSGVYLYDVRERTLTSHFSLNIERPERMNGNNIRSMYKDAKGRVWMSVYPKGVTFYDEGFPEYTWYINHRGNPASLSDDLVNAVMEDSDGDIWFATNNGLDIYSPDRNEWTHLLGRSNLGEGDSLRNSMFLSLCEFQPGIVLAGGFMTGVYRIDKKTLTYKQLVSEQYASSFYTHSGSNSYIRVLYKDSQGLQWTGGNKYLGCTDPTKKALRKYPIDKAIMCIAEYDSTTLFVGTDDGVYKFDKRDSTFHYMRMPFASQQIRTMYLHTNGNLYIGTSNSGLVELQPDGKYTFYQQLTSALFSNTVNTIVPKNENELIVATESNVALFYIKERKFVNWTQDYGLIETTFSPRAGIHTRRGTFLFGTGNGAIEWADTMKIPRYPQSEMLIDQILLDNRNITDKKQKVVSASASESRLEYKYAENLLACHVVIINYDNPLSAYLQWKLEGKNDHWSAINEDNWIQFQNLLPGEYTLRVQYIAREDFRVLKEKSLRIVVLPSFWQTKWAWGLYVSVVMLILISLFRYHRMRTERTHSKEQVGLMLRTIRCAQTRLSLISSVATDMLKRRREGYGLDLREEENGVQQMKYNAENLQQMFSNLMNIEYQASKPQLNMSVCPLDGLAQSVVESFQAIAKVRGVQLVLSDDTEGVEVVMDEECVRTVLFNILSNLIRNSRTVDIIQVRAWARKKEWGFTVTNVNAESRGADMDDHRSLKDIINRRNVHQLEKELRPIRMLVSRHGGIIICKGYNPLEYSFSIEFPYRRLPTEFVRNKGGRTSDIIPFVEWKRVPRMDYLFRQMGEGAVKSGTLLIVEDALDMNTFFNRTLGAEWDIVTIRDGQTALQMVEDKRPDVILIDSILADMQGAELCSVIKSNVSTSHIPIILLGSVGSIEEAVDGYKVKADHYLAKPVDIALLRAILNNLLDNRLLLKERMQQVDVVHNLKNIKDANMEREAQFLTKINEVIGQHVLDADFSVDVLAALMGMSRTSMYNRIKELTGQTPSDMIRDIRMRRAGEMLLSDEYNIMEVSERLGFSEPKYFREVFKKYYGVSPSEYIRMQARRR